MIRVCKPPSPMRLEKGGVVRTKEDCAAYDANPNDYLNGTRKFKFERTIYGHNSVKETLRKVQHKKCCFCEGRFVAFAAADVEHYRPKGAVQQDEKSSRLIPGYYWLAYSWENLYWCCQVCNRNNKKNYFPLVNPSKRARSHNDDIANEKPLILNPGGQEDPRHHIKFRDAIAIGSTRAGQKTLEIVGLNRVTLIDDRLTRLNELRLLLEIVEIFAKKPAPKSAQLLKKAHHQLRAAVQSAAVFSAMAANFLASTSYTEASEEITD